MNIKGSSAEKRSPEKSCWGDIRELISKHLNRQDSRYILGGRKAAKGWDYYYSLEDLPSIDEVVLAVKNGTLIIPDGIEKLRFEIGSFLEKSEEPCFVKLRETETDYQLHFQGISGYEMVRSYNKKPAIRILTEKRSLLKISLSKNQPYIWIQSASGTYPFWFTWWMNRLIINNRRFRLILLEILKRMGEDISIYSDIAYCIEKHHYCLLDIPLCVAGKYTSKGELIRAAIKEDLPLEYDKYDLNYLFAVGRIAESTDEEDLILVQELEEEDILKWVSFDSYCMGSGVMRAVRGFRYEHNLNFDLNSLNAYSDYENRMFKMYQDYQNIHSEEYLIQLDMEEKIDIASKLEEILGVSVSIES